MYERTIQKNTPPGSGQRLLQHCYTLFALCLMLFTVYFCYAIVWRGPFRDLWEFIGIIQGQLDGRWQLDELLEPYGGIHRIAIPKLLFYLDYRLAHGNNLLAMSTTLLLHIAACTIFIHSISASGNITRQDHLLLFSTTLLFFFSTTQIYNLIYISDNQVVIANSFAIFAAFIFCRYLCQKQVISLYLANAIVVIACLSHSSSLMMWPAMIVMMFLLKKPKKEISIQIMLASLVLALYVSGNAAIQNPVQNILMNTGGILRYIGLHLSSPTSREYPVAGIIVTYVSIGYLVTIALRVYHNRWQPDRSEMFWMTLAFCGVFIALVTAYGRQIYPNSAVTDRYQTLVMTYWAALAILFYIDLKQQKPALAVMAPVFSLILLLPYQYKNAEEMAWLSSRVNIAHTAATVGITDMDVIAATLSHPLLMDKKNLVAKYNDFLRENKLGYFSETSAEYFLQRNDTTVFSQTIASHSACKGKLLAIEKITNGNYKFYASAYTDDRSAIENIIVVDSRHKVIGLGRHHRQKGEFFPQAQKNWQWIGFIRPLNEGDYPLTFAAKNNGRYCALFSTTY